MTEKIVFIGNDSFGSGGIMDSYVIRIYRRGGNDPEKIAGLVEFVEQDETKPFANYDELRQILNQPGCQRQWKKRKCKEEGVNGNISGIRNRTKQDKVKRRDF